MNMKEGNKEKWHGEGGIGLISSRLTLEGPLVKNKSSILLSGRRTYADLIITDLKGDGRRLMQDTISTTLMQRLITTSEERTSFI